MGSIKQFIEKRTAPNVRNPAYWIGSGGNRTSAGISVNANTAMQVSAVYACVDLFAWTLASVPWITYNSLIPRGKERATQLKIYSLLHDEPNPEQSSFVFRSTAMAHACLHGNAYAEIEFDNNGDIIALWPLPAWKVKPSRTQKNELFYQVILPDGQMKNLPPYQVWHIQALGTSGDEGLSIIGQVREAIGLSLATQQFGGHFFSHGANVGGIVSTPKYYPTLLLNTCRLPWRRNMPARQGPPSHAP